MPGRRKLPAIMDMAVKRIKAQSPGVNPYAVASSVLQKSGSLKKGTNQPTKKGLTRGKMTRAQRQRNPP
jgi:hypothetical protein